MSLVGIETIVGMPRYSAGDFEPPADDTYDLGSSSLRWNTLYVGTGGIESDGNISLGANLLIFDTVALKKYSSAIIVVRDASDTQDYTLQAREFRASNGLFSNTGAADTILRQALSGAGGPSYYLKLQTLDSADTVVDRLTINNRVDEATATWNAVVHTGLKLGGDLTLNGYALDAGATNLTVKSTTGGAGIIMEITGNTPSPAVFLGKVLKTGTPAAGDMLVSLSAQGYDSSLSLVTYGVLRFEISDPTAGAPDGLLRMQLMRANSLTDVLTIDENGATLDIGAGKLTVETTGGDIADIKRVTSAAVGPSFRLILDKSIAGAAGDRCAYLIGTGKTDAGAQKDFGYITFDVVDPTAGAEDSSIGFWTRSGGSIVERITIDGDGLELNGYYIDGWSTQTTVGAAGAASAPPANPTGYVKIKVGGTVYVIPYYNAS